MHPDPQDYPFDLDAALASVVVVRAAIPEDAFTAGPLGTEQAGYGVLIRGDGLVQSSDENGEGEDHNMIVPINLLAPIMDDMLTLGKPRHPARPWLGVYATEIDGRVVIANLAGNGPAAGVGLRLGDLIIAAAGGEVGGLAAFYRRVWALGAAGGEVPLRIYRDGKAFDVTVVSADRSDFLKSPVAH